MRSPIRSPLSSSIQFALQKFERNCAQPPDFSYRKSPSPVRNINGNGNGNGTTAKDTTISKYIVDPVTSFPEHLIPTTAAPAMSTWPLKKPAPGSTTKKPSPTPMPEAEVVREEERLINALKTGVMDTVDDSSPKPYSCKLVNEENKNMLRNRGVANGGTANGNGTTNGNGAKEVTGLSALSARRLRPNGGWSSREVPHPELSSQQKANIRSGSAANLINPVRPFLTRGSVAERVLIFEKCPTELCLDKRKTTVGSVANRVQNYSKDAKPKPGGPPPHTTLQRHVKVRKPVFIPRFHFPHGRPKDQNNLEKILDAVRVAFQSLPKPQASKEEFGIITKAAGCPLFWKAPLFLAAGGDKLGYVEQNHFLDYWKSVSMKYHDSASLFMHILTRGASRNYLDPEDFIPLVQDVVDTHPGLVFLKQATEFHSRYILTVVSRIYYNVNQMWNGRISLSELRRSDLLRSIARLEEEEDINQMTQYFSYEHFYVIYCKFWELDRDHDLCIDKHDLARHSDHALSSRIIDRIFSGTVTHGDKKDRMKAVRSPTSDRGENSNYEMCYADFVWFLLAEEDKTHPRAIEYWFRCMDLDGDGFLSMYELDYFYDEQLRRMESIGIECLPFEDCLCQMLDMIKPAVPNKISLSDLKKSKMTSIFFDTFFNLEKYLDHEQRDPFASQRDHAENEISDWDRYAAEEYELLVAEEGGHENPDEITPYSDDESSESASDEGHPCDGEDLLSPNLDDIYSANSAPLRKPFRASRKLKPDIEYMYITGNPTPPPVDLSESMVFSNQEFRVSSPLGLLSSDFMKDTSKWPKNEEVSTDDSADYAADSDDCSL
ncbi:serine/threonine-protein phosphatase 2A regulatory subunit B'' subunit delta isoform X1 [Bemisia tabaci]|uniref:serine/threonine-protein phosphatase 2A regulatory subunit B'' subunit delta isoform X1 n=1 Tax=Bemisia tabaci TaxID=7038 RepID=UPI003B287123